MKKIFLISIISGAQLLFILFAPFVLTSCNIYRTISFNADHSGSMETKIDMTQMVAMMNENGGTGTSGMGSMADMSSLDQTRQKLEAIAGISNVKVSYDTTGIMYSSYDFNSTDALAGAMGAGGVNKSMMMGDDGAPDPKPKLTFKGKKFYLEDIDKKTLKKMQSEETKKEMAQMDMILASSNYYTTINFPLDVKKVSYKNATITNEKSVNYVMPIKDFISKDYKPLVVNLK